jgi:hypothetical protein
MPKRGKAPTSGETWFDLTTRGIEAGRQVAHPAVGGEAVGGTDRGTVEHARPASTPAIITARQGVLLQDPVHVILDRGQRDAEPAGDLLVHQPLPDQCQDLGLAPGQRARRRCGTVADNPVTRESGR